MEYFDTILSLPITDPVLLFSVVLLIILFAPMIFDKLHIPHIVGLIIAGVLFGENGLGLLSNDSSFQLFGQVGMLYIMFIAGIDMDMNDFMHNRNKSIVFGAYTFFIPVVIGFGTGFILMYHIFNGLLVPESLLRYTILAAIVLASMFASNTLLAYPIVSRYGVSRNRSVTITVGGTMVAMLLSLVVLAVVLQIAKGDMTPAFWIRFIVSVTLYLFIVFFLFPKLTAWFFKHYADNILQYIFVLALVLLSSFLAKLAGMEYIIGAFLAGISINRLIPKRSPLMNRINFVGNAIFIPFFLISVGMMVDVKLIFGGFTTILVALIMTAVATLSKFLAADATRLTYNMSPDERTMMFGLSNAKAAYSLVAVMLAYNCVIGVTETGTEVRLLTSEILNGTIIMILFTCIISSFVTEKAAKRLAATGEEKAHASDYRPEMRVLLPISNEATLEKLMELAVILNDSKYKQPMYALNVVDYQSVDTKEADNVDKLLERAAYLGASTDNKVKKIKRYDLNVASGITNVIREKNISDVVMGVSRKPSLSDSLFGSLYDTITSSVNRMVYILSSNQPLSTTNRILLVVPVGAENESGFEKWCVAMLTLAGQTGASIEMYATEKVIKAFKTIAAKRRNNVAVTYTKIEKFSLDEPLNKLRPDDLLVVISARRHSFSYTVEQDKLIQNLVSKVKSNSFIVLYPEQFKEGEIDRLSDSNTKII